MQAVIINYNDFQRFETLDKLLEYYFPLIGWAKGIVSSGVGVTVFQRYRETRDISREGILIHLVSDPGPDTTPYQFPLPLHRRVVKLCRENIQRGEQTIVHLNGLLYPLQTRLLGRQLPRACPLIVQHHGSRPWAKGLRRAIQRWGLQAVDGFLFSTAELAQEWLKADIIRNPERVYEVMETSAVFRYEDRPAARAKTGLKGDPVVFWAGNLNENKDPLTVLAGFAEFKHDYPEAQLYMAYRQGPLLNQVEKFLEENLEISANVTLLGTIPHDRMADYFNSADLFVQGSSKEGSGLAMLECLACGVVPIVTDIPAFRTMTAQGQVGALWPVGDAVGLANRMREVIKRPIEPQSLAARDLFEANWTFEAIGRQAASIYRRVIEKKL